MILNLKEYSRFFFTLSGVLALGALYTTHLLSFLFFHSIAEMISVGIACALFLLSWNLRDLSEDHSIIFIGIAFLFTGILDLIHALSYQGMNVIPGTYSANMATQLWIAARYLQSLSLLLMPFMVSRSINYKLVFSSYSLVTLLLLLSIAYWHIFPDCFIEGHGLTGFKIFSEYLVSLFLALAVFFLSRKKIILRHWCIKAFTVFNRTAYFV